MTNETGLTAEEKVSIAARDAITRGIAAYLCQHDLDLAMLLQDPTVASLQTELQFDETSQPVIPASVADFVANQYPGTTPAIDRITFGYARQVMGRAGERMVYGPYQPTTITIEANFGQRTVTSDEDFYCVYIPSLERYLHNKIHVTPYTTPMGFTIMTFVPAQVLNGNITRYGGTGRRPVNPALISELAALIPQPDVPAGP